MLPAPIPREPNKWSRLAAALMTGLAAFAWAAGAQGQADAGGSESGPGAAVTAGIPDSAALERALQSLSWEQFKAVVVAIPKLKADVDAYGPLGWQYVQANYRTYPWRKNINKLHEPQKERLSDLIEEARAGGAPEPGRGRQ
jgi:hypothetical protein